MSLVIVVWSCLLHRKARAPPGRRPWYQWLVGNVVQAALLNFFALENTSKKVNESGVTNGSLSPSLVRVSTISFPWSPTWDEIHCRWFSRKEDRCFKIDALVLSPHYFFAVLVTGQDLSCLKSFFLVLFSSWTSNSFISTWRLDQLISYIPFWFLVHPCVCVCFRRFGLPPLDLSGCCDVIIIYSVIFQLYCM